MMCPLSSRQRQSVLLARSCAGDGYPHNMSTDLRGSSMINIVALNDDEGLLLSPPLVIVKSPEASQTDNAGAFAKSCIQHLDKQPQIQSKFNHFTRCDSVSHVSVETTDTQELTMIDRGQQILVENDRDMVLSPSISRFKPDTDDFVDRELTFSEDLNCLRAPSALLDNSMVLRFGGSPKTSDQPHRNYQAQEVVVGPNLEALGNPPSPVIGSLVYQDFSLAEYQLSSITTDDPYSGGHDDFHAPVDKLSFKGASVPDPLSEDSNDSQVFQYDLIGHGNRQDYVFSDNESQVFEYPHCIDRNREIPSPEHVETSENRCRIGQHEFDTDLAAKRPDPVNGDTHHDPSSDIARPPTYMSTQLLPTIRARHAIRKRTKQQKRYAQTSLNWR
uniref:Uncharacterized protein n=1 Tax=Spongospora subterranea TaxID=70186 RepID=A0A0H5RAZ6_9EUKA|eukprot:CRZ11218.1 hypothetical protein [Spongospora subterranea]